MEVLACILRKAMIYKPTISHGIEQELKQLWGLADTDKIIEITAFGDFFVKSNEEYLFYSLTDGKISNVTQDILEFGLPPVEVALGDEWYQLDAQSFLKEEGQDLAVDQCFAFVTPVFLGGDYGPDNIHIEDICQYTRRIHGLVGKNTQ
jgi:hypothetical protein